jgi:hypothetical protein
LALFAADNADIVVICDNNKEAYKGNWKRTSTKRFPLSNQLICELVSLLLSSAVLSNILAQLQAFSLLSRVPEHTEYPENVLRAERISVCSCHTQIQSTNRNLQS